MIRKAPLLALGLLVVLLAGCEVQYASVKGRVLLDGKPLKGATVGFYPDKGRGSHGVTDDDGRYELHYTRDTAGVPPGKCIVRITTADPNTPEKLPRKYHEDSELSEEVKASNNVFDFDLKSGK